MKKIEYIQKFLIDRLLESGVSVLETEWMTQVLKTQYPPSKANTFKIAWK